MNINELVLSASFQGVVRGQIAEKEREISELRSLLKIGKAGAHGEDGPDGPGGPAMAAAVNAVPDAPIADIIAFVASTPGATAALIKKQFQLTREQWDSSRVNPAFKTAVESKGQKRGTRYFIRENG